MNHAILYEIEEHVLVPEAIEQVIALSWHDEAADEQRRLANEAKLIEKKLKNIQSAIEAGGSAVTLIQRIRELEERQQEIAALSASLKPIPRLPAQVIESRLGEWRQALRGSTTQSRAVLQRLLVGRIVFTPTAPPFDPQAEPDRYTFEARTRYDKLFYGVAMNRPEFLKEDSRIGLEGMGPTKTELDYGRVLERFYGKLLASPTGFEEFSAGFGFRAELVPAA